MLPFSRRDFLKLGSILSGAVAASRLASLARISGARSSVSTPNILIFVFDAMSAKNLSLYGYRRKTTPNLERLAERSTVFNQHYSAATFTTPGTASLLTGLYPWTHRAINYSGLIARSLAEQNLFHAVGDRYFRLAFSQNLWPNYFFGQFRNDIGEVLSPAAFSLVDQMVSDKLPRDRQTSQRALDEFMFEDGRPPSSLVLGLAERILLRRAFARAPAQDYPRGLPRTGYYPIFYTLKDVFDGMLATVEKLHAPALAYLHDWAPHAPYRPSKEFDHAFADGRRPKPKPEHKLGDHIPQKHLNERRQNYDEYVANVDFEFGRVLDGLQAKGMLDNSYVLVTADHGELFERGVEGHGTHLLYEAVTRVPLLIAAPGQRSRQDVNIPTSSVDVLPTVAHLSGGPVPSWCEGQILPTLGGSGDPQRSVYMMDAKENSAFAPLQHRASFALRKGPYKLIYYKGYSEYKAKDAFELYNIENDPEELNDLYSQASSIVAELRAELLTKVRAENAKFKA